jgi:hypothetical protein
VEAGGSTRDAGAGGRVGLRVCWRHLSFQKGLEMLDGLGFGGFKTLGCGEEEGKLGERNSVRCG